MLKRGFITPFFWTSEDYSTALIRRRIAKQAFRSIWQQKQGSPINLRDHVQQQTFVQQKLGIRGDSNSAPNDAFLKLWEQFAETDEHSIIFNFLNGDEASKVLGYTCFGITDYTAFDYARYLAGII